MKYEYRITKYNPDYRKLDGSYSRNEWTAISDVGKKFGRRVLTKQEYIEVEREYISAAIKLMEEAKVPYLQIIGLERGKKSGFKDGQKCGPTEVRKIVREALRENLWCILHLSRRMFVHFGYDYYMYIGISKPCEGSVHEIGQGKLFVEECKSPYSDTLKRIKKRKAWITKRSRN